LLELYENTSPPTEDTKCAKLLEKLEDKHKAIEEHLAKREEDAVGGLPEWQVEHPFVVDLQVCRGGVNLSPQAKLGYIFSLRRLALAFSEWEYNKFKTTKVQEVINNPTPPKRAGRIQSYLREKDQIIDKSTATHGIRHGIKILVIEQLARILMEVLDRKMGNRPGSEAATTSEFQMSGLSAVLAFTFTAFRELTYGELYHFVVSLPHSKKIFDLARKKSVWFQKCEELYLCMSPSLYDYDFD